MRYKQSLSRREWLGAGGACVLGMVLGQSGCAPLASSSRKENMKPGTIRFGYVTDMHYADAPMRGNRYYRQTKGKLAECIRLMNSEKVDFLIECGDFKDQDEPPQEAKTLQYLQSVEAVFRRFRGPRYHVLGNHDMDSISKQQFLARTENTDIPTGLSYYAFDRDNWRFILLDANYRTDGRDYDHGQFEWTDANIPAAELEWLEKQLQTAPAKAVVFSHQLLDGTGDYYVKNAAQVREILQKSGKTPLVLQGHHHAGHYSFVEGIHYYTLKAVVEGDGRENNAYAIVEIPPKGDIVIRGYRRAVSKKMPI